MKLVTKPLPVLSDPCVVAMRNLTAELHRVIVAVDEIKGRGHLDEVDAAQKVLGGALVILDGLTRRV